MLNHRYNQSFSPDNRQGIVITLPLKAMSLKAQPTKSVCVPVLEFPSLSVSSGFSESNLPLNSVSDVIVSDADGHFAASASSVNKSCSLRLGDDLPNETAKTHSQLKANLAFYTGRSRFGKLNMNGDRHIRQSPGGRQSGSTGSASGWGQSSVSATSGGGGGSLSSSQMVTGFSYGAGSSGDDDDDPWKQRRQVEHTPGHYLEHMNFEGVNFGQFDPFEYLTQEDRNALVGVGPLLSPGIDPALRVNLDVTGGPQLPANGDASDQSYSDQMPGTPMSMFPPTPMSMMPSTPGLPATPMSLPPQTPGTPNSSRIHAPIPVNTPNSDHSSDIGELFDISRLMSSGGNRTAPIPQPTPQPERPSYQSFTSPQHRPPPPRQSLPVQETPSGDPNPEEFFRCSTHCRNGERVVQVSVNSELSSITKDMACKALVHCRNLCEQYKEQVDKPCYLRVAMHNKARVCNFRIDTWTMKLIFTMPEDCESCMYF